MSRLRAALTAVGRGYGREEGVLSGYAALMSVYGLLSSAGVGAGVLSGATAPERLRTQDLVLLSVATQRISRLVAKDAVLSPLRAPVTRFVGAGSPGEVKEEVRGTGVRHAVGELLTCPFCVAQWVATGLVTGMVIAPRATRLVASVFVVSAAADALHFALDGLARSAG